jgi:hypothetical protein
VSFEIDWREEAPPPSRLFAGKALNLGARHSKLPKFIEMPSFHSDKSKKHYTFNPGKKGNLSEQPLILLNYLASLNQRVHNSNLRALPSKSL